MTLWLSTRWTVDRQIGRQGRAEVDRAEAGDSGAALHLLEIQAGAAEQVGGDVALQPALEQHRRPRAFAEHDIVILARRRLDGVPAIAGALGLVDDERADRAAPRRFLELVGPAPVIGHRPPAEAARDRIARRRLEIGVVDQEDRDLAVEVDVAEIVPAALGRGHAIADEDHRRIGDRGPLASRAPC